MESSILQSPPTPNFENDWKPAVLPLYQAKGWLRFLGVMSILEGVLDVLSIVGIIVAWLPIWLGVLLFQAAGDAERAYVGGDLALLAAANRRMKTYFVLRGVTILVQVAIFFLAISLFGTLGILGALSEL